LVAAAVAACLQDFLHARHEWMLHSPFVKGGQGTARQASKRRVYIRTHYNQPTSEITADYAMAGLEVRYFGR